MASLRRSLLLLASGGFVSGVSLRMAEPLLPTVADDLGAGVAEASILITAFTLAYGLFQLVHGPLGDRFGKIRTVSIAMLLAAAGSGACATAASLGELALYRFLTGMTAGAVIPLSFAFVGDNIPFETRQTVLGRFIAGTLLGATCGPLVGGIGSDLVGWRASFLVPCAAFALIGLALALEAGSEEVGGGADYRPVARYLALMRSAAARTICLAVTIEGALFYGAFAYLGAYLRFEHGLGYTHIGLILAGFGIGGVVYSLAVGWLVRHWGAQRMVTTGAWLMLAGFLALAAIPAWTGAVPAVLVLGFSFYLLHNTLQTRATEMAPAARGSAISAFAFCLFFGQALGALVLGAVVETAGYRVMLAAAGLGLVVLALWFAGRLRTL